MNLTSSWILDSFRMQKIICLILQVVYKEILTFRAMILIWTFTTKNIHVKLMNNREFTRGISLCNYQTISQGRSYLDTNVDISDCFFSRSQLYNGDGGVIYISGSSYVMSITYSMFFNCCSTRGGAIYFDSKSSLLNKICSSKSSASTFQFAYISTSDNNYVDYLSNSLCNNVNGDQTFIMYMGNQRIENANFSFNNGLKVSGIIINSSIICSSKFCTFSKNNVSERICMLFCYNSGTISYANIIQNNSPILYGVLTTWTGSSNQFLYCILINNEDTLFYVYSGMVELLHCCIFHQGNFSSSNQVTTNNNNSFTKQSTYIIRFFSSHHCITDTPEQIRNENPITYKLQDLPVVNIIFSCIIFFIHH